MEPILKMTDFTPQEQIEIQAIDDMFSAVMVIDRNTPLISGPMSGDFGQEVANLKAMCHRRKDEVAANARARKALLHRESKHE